MTPPDAGGRASAPLLAGRRTLLGGLALAALPRRWTDLARARTTAHAAEVPAWPRTLTARTGMAAQVVDFGWTRDAAMFGTAGPDGCVTSEIHAIEAGARQVRFLFHNGLRTGWTISGASFAATAEARSGAVDADGRPVAPRPVTFGNAGRDIAPAEQAAAPDGPRARALDLPPAGDAAPYGPGAAYGAPPAIVFSDWMPLDPVARRDGRPGCLVSLRVRTPSPRFTGVTPTYLHDARFFAGTPDRPWRALYLTGDGGVPDYLGSPEVTDPEPLEHYLGNALCCGVQWIGTAPGLTLASVGDSILMGGGEPLGYLGPIRRAAERLSTPQRPVSHVGAATFGSPSAAFLAAGRDAIRTNRVSCAFVQVWSGNDPQTVDASRAACDAALGFARECIGRGVTPVLCSPAPRPASGATPEAEAVRLWSMPLLRALAAQGVPVLDIDAIVGDGAANGRFTRFRPGLAADDDIHPNGAGNALIADAALSILRAMPVVVA